MDIAILDDDQGVALDLADWSGLQQQGRVEVFSDHLAGAAVDVFDVEPLPDQDLQRSTPGLLAAPTWAT